MSANQINTQQQTGIVALQIRGFKPLVRECRLEIRPLTILAGANNSGKSSAMQPLLLLKQTLEASYDPGPLLLYGPNVRFTSAKQFLSITEDDQHTSDFTVSITDDQQAILTIKFESTNGRNIVISEMSYHNGSRTTTLRPGMTPESILPELPAAFKRITRILAEEAGGGAKWQVSRKRSFLVAKLPLNPDISPNYYFEPSERIEPTLRGIIHVPGLRGNPTRTYKTTAFGSMFPGTFENYVASIIHHWQASRDKRLFDLEEVLALLGLTWKLEAKQVDNIQVELRIGRRLRHIADKTENMVNIADVGFGVSQVLPVLVALLVASPKQLVYLEQPEIHLHPRAQAALAQVLIDAANRGVYVVAETHSSLLLTAIQTRVARGEMAPDQVMLHWFQRGEDGVTQVTSAELDETGAFGEWPEDFADVELEVESRFLEAVEAKLMEG